MNKPTPVILSTTFGCCLAVLGLAGGSPAHAQEAPAADPSTPPPGEGIPDGVPLDEAAAEPGEPPAPPPTIEDVDERLRRAEDALLGPRRTPTWTGYVDFGFFVPGGNGAGYVQDYGHAFYPQYAQYGWVFAGDIFAPAVNSRGEPADLGDAPGVDRFDSVNSKGAPGFILNEVNFNLESSMTSNAFLSASFNLVPRTGNDFRWGDFFDLDLAQLEWVPTKDQRTSIFIGKIDSVIGIEYRDRKAPKRFGVTPSLLARYTTGTALGLKVRSKFGPDDLVVVAAALTNGSNTVEPFHFYDEVDSNAGKTGSARVSVRLPVPGELELGVSGSYGAQDRALSSRYAMWFFGVDALGHLGPLDVKAQWLKGKAPGWEPDGVYGLNLHQGAYLELDYMVTSSLGVLGRGEFRDALVWLGTERLYVTKSWRATVGGRWVISEKAALRAEYLRNGEYSGPHVRNDVFTSSLVMSF
jgi:hypothetical protein